MKILNRFGKGFKPVEKLEAGIALLGSEVKALRDGHADITGSYVRITGSEAYLINGKIFPYKFSRLEGYREDRSRKLLLHKKEILALKSRMDQGRFTIVPLSIYLKDGITDEDKQKLWDLLEAEKFSLFMYTSCGWFFDDISGIEKLWVWS